MTPTADRRSCPSPLRAVLWGMAHAFDLGAMLAPPYGAVGGSPADDARALAGDWSRALRRADTHVQER